MISIHPLATEKERNSSESTERHLLLASDPTRKFLAHVTATKGMQPIHIRWLVTLTAAPQGMGSNPGEAMDVCKGIKTPALNIHRATSPLESWEAHHRMFSLKIGVELSEIILSHV
ncbi:hypothetical protein TNCV_2555441 [Trichonephila clavipes]|nr:hypothetical protein TNCV_2555441 [Trichonephila clavipes]